MRTITRNNYTPKIGDYHEIILKDPEQRKVWLFDCDGVYTEILKTVFVADSFGNSTEKAASQRLVTVLNDEIGDLTNLSTEDKTSIVNAINELVANYNPSDYNSLDNRPKINGVTLEGDKLAGALGLASELDFLGEQSARQEADSNMEEQILSNAGNITELQGQVMQLNEDMTGKADETDLNDVQSAINKTVVSDLTYTENASTVSVTENKVNISTGTTTTETEALPVASATAAGIMNAATYQSIADSQETLDALLGGAVAIGNLPANPTQQQLTTAWETATGRSELINRASIYDTTNGLIHTYYTNVNLWEDSPAGAQVQVSQATNTELGIVKGSLTNGQAFAETNGTLSVNGWDDLVQDVTDNAGDISALEADKLGIDNVLAGNNVTVTKDAQNSTLTIAATDTTYSAFVGTDGTTAGTAGLVPAPATTDDGKFLKADGTWGTVSAGPAVVQTTGQSTTDVMSQKAVTDIIGDVETILATLNSGTGASK